MKALLAGAALAAGLGGAVAAQAPSTLGFVETPGPMDIRGAELIGATVYAASGGAGAAAVGDVATLDRVGSIDDLVLTRGGALRAVLIDVGAFLGAGPKTVAIETGALRFVAAAGDAEDWRVVIDASREAFEAAPAFRDGERSPSAPSAP